MGITGSGASLERDVILIPLPPPHALPTQIARGVADLHRIGLVHLALSPDNIGLTDACTEKGDVRIGGFSAVRDTKHASRDRDEVRCENDNAGYRAPEKSKGVTADIF